MSKRGINTGKKTKTQQQFKDETNVNHIVNRFSQTGQLPRGTHEDPLYLDHTQFGDYTEMLNQVTRVNQSFTNLPSKLRARFQNQPKKLLEFLHDPENQEEAIKLGIIKAPTEPETTLKDLNETIKSQTKPKSPSNPEGSQTDLVDDVVKTDEGAV